MKYFQSMVNWLKGLFSFKAKEPKNAEIPLLRDNPELFEQVGGEIRSRSGADPKRVAEAVRKHFAACDIRTIADEHVGGTKVPIFIFKGETHNSPTLNSPLVSDKSRNSQLKK